MSGGHRVGLALLALGCAGAGAARAQDSQFGIRGLGTPGRGESVRARATGGAFAPFDALSPLIEASLADVGRVTASAVGTASYRRADLSGASTSLRTYRFPATVLAGPLGRRVVVGGAIATYLDRTFGIVTQDTIAIRGNPEAYTDEITSDGGVSDLRLAVAARLRSSLAAGLGLHVLAGSARVTASRRFADSTVYRSALQADETQYDGLGFSASAILDVTAELRVAGYARSDTRLHAEVGGVSIGSTDLPLTLGGALRWQPAANARLAAGLAWRSWADAGTNAFNTLGWSVGAELGSSDLPLRLGVRGGQLPFGPGGAGGRAPTEWGAAAGTGRDFAGGRGLIDVGLERLRRTGGGLTETVWTWMVGITVRP